MKWFMHSYSEDMAPGCGPRLARPQGPLLGPPQARGGGLIVSPTSEKTWISWGDLWSHCFPMGDLQGWVQLP